jgi:uncharacterized protein (DUF1499 family)
VDAGRAQHFAERNVYKYVGDCRTRIAADSAVLRIRSAARSEIDGEIRNRRVFGHLG